MFGKGMTHLADGTVGIISQTSNEKGTASNSKGFIEFFTITVCLLSASRFLDRPFDIIFRHVGRPRFAQGQPQTGIAFGIVAS